MINSAVNFLFYLLIFIAPIIMAPFTSELFEFNKMIIIYLLTTLIMATWIFKMITYRKIIIKKTFLDIPIFLFLGSQILSTIFSIDRHTSFYGYYGRFNGGLLSIISYVVLYYAFVSNLRTSDVMRLLKISLVSSFIVILWGVPGKLGHDVSCLLFTGNFTNSCWTDQFRPAERMFSTLGQPNWLGAYLAVHFFLALYFFVTEVIKEKHSRIRSLLYSAYLVLNLVAILFTRSRSALFAVIAGLILFSIFFYYRLRRSISYSTPLKLVTLLSVFVVLILIFKTGIQKIDKYISLSTYIKVPVQTDSSANELIKQSASGVTESGDIRKIVWKGAIDLGLKYPIFGTGVETFAYSYYFTRPQEHNLTSEWDFLYNKAHNEYLNYFATTGFVGVLSYLVMIGSIVIYVFKISNFKFPISKQASNSNNELLTVCLFISYLTILVTNFFGFSTTTINLYFYLIPACMLILTLHSGKESEKSTLSVANAKQWLLISIFSLSFIGMIVYLVRYYLADMKYAQADNLSKIGEHQKAVPYFNEALNLRSDHVYQDKLSYTLANVAFLASYQKENDLANRMMSISSLLNQASLESSKSNVLYWKTMAKNHYLYYQITLDKKDLEAGVQALKQAAKLAPTDPKIPYSLAIFYSLLEEEESNTEEKQEFQIEAFKEIDKTLIMKSNYRDGYFLKAQLLKKAGKSAEAKQQLEFILTNLNPQDSEVQEELKTFQSN